MAYGRRYTRYRRSYNRYNSYRPKYVRRRSNYRPRRRSYRRRQPAYANMKSHNFLVNNLGVNPAKLLVTTALYKKWGRRPGVLRGFGTRSLEELNMLTGMTAAERVAVLKNPEYFQEYNPVFTRGAPKRNTNTNPFQ